MTNPGRQTSTAPQHLLVCLLATLLGRYRFEPAPELGGGAGLAARAQLTMALTPRGGLPLIPVPR